MPTRGLAGENGARGRWHGVATSPGSSCAPECALQSLPSGGLLPYLCSHLQVRQGRAIPQVPHRCPTGAPQMPHRHTPACRHVRGWFLPGGWTGAEHREWRLDTLKSYINVNKPTISAPGVYFPVNMQKCWGRGYLTPS